MDHRRRLIIWISLLIFFISMLPTGKVLAQTPTSTPIGGSNINDPYWSYSGWEYYQEGFYCIVLDSINNGNNYSYIKWPNEFQPSTNQNQGDTWNFTTTRLKIFNIGTNGFSTSALNALYSGQSIEYYPQSLMRLYNSGGLSFTAKVCSTRLPIINAPDPLWNFPEWYQEANNYYCADFTGISTTIGSNRFLYIKWPSQFISSNLNFTNDLLYLPDSNITIKNTGNVNIKWKVNNGSDQPQITPGSTANLSYSGILGTRNIFFDTQNNPPANSILSIKFCIQKTSDNYRPSAGREPIWGSIVQDGDMEDQPVSSAWMPLYSTGRSKFGRIQTSSLTSMFNVSMYGYSRCNSGMQIIGNAHSSNPLQVFASQGDFSNITQPIDWPGGKFNFRFSLKAYNHPVQVVIKLVYISVGNYGQEYYLYNGFVGPEAWMDVNSSNSQFAPAGGYAIHVSLGGASSGGDSYFAIDDFVLSDQPVSGVVCSVSLPPTSVPTITPTGPTPTIDYLKTSTPVYTRTPTPTIIPTTSYNGTNVIQNCGFGFGDTYWGFSGYWDYSYWHETAYVVYSADNYGFVESGASLPGLYQSFYWPGGTAYVKWYSPSSSGWDVRFINSVTRASYLVSTGWPNADNRWHQYTIYLPAGNYDLNLNSNSYYGDTYDNISVSTGNFSTCVQTTNGAMTPSPVINASQTPLPSWTPTGMTPTMWPTSTQRPTSTAAAGLPTSTPQKTFTPYPTYTPYVPPAPTFTQQPWRSPTPYPTYTQQATYTPLPTYTPNGAGTIEPSPTTSPTPPPPPQQAPPDYYALCERPQSAADLAGWQEFEKCQILSFFSMSPNAVSTVAAVPTMMNGSEPFGTFNELKDTNSKVKSLVDSYDWNNTGLPGMKDAPSVDAITNPGANSPWITGKFDFTKNSSTQTSTVCNTSYNKILGPYFTPPFCFLINIMRDKGILPWIQLLVNIAALGFLAIYLWHKWIDAGAG